MLFEPVAAVVTDSEQGKEAIAELKKKRPMLKAMLGVCWGGGGVRAAHSFCCHARLLHSKVQPMLT